MGKHIVNVGNVPANLRHLIPLARRFGVADDSERAQVVASASTGELGQLHQAVLTHEEQLDAWLAGPEASGPNYSDEYIMFSAMRMAADHAV
jgi:hypothetical protein